MHEGPGGPGGARMSKSELRASSLRSRRSLSSGEMQVLSERVAERFVGLLEFVEAKVVATYVAKDDEVGTSRIIEGATAAGKTLIVPRSDPSGGTLSFHVIRSMSELSRGHFGVLEPSAEAEEVLLDSADIAAIPVVSWDERGHRLGYGKGFFDRALAASPGPLRVGLALEAQKAPSIPQSPGDVPLDVIVTEARTLRFGRSRR